MTKKLILQSMWHLILISFFFFLSSPFCFGHTLRLLDEKIVSFPELLEDLKTVRVIFVGEKHDNLQHHQAQLQIIQGLHAESVNLAIGLEMFRVDSQKALDDWVSGSLEYNDFVAVYHDNWTYWEEYANIYYYAREKKVPLVGLNISREITRQVALKGFAALSDEQLEKLPVVQCKVDQPYMEFIKRALGGHGLKDIQFRYFCEAQMLWDKVMAKHLKDYLARNPKTTVVVLAGGGHSWKYGIPAQFEKISDIPYRVLLPEIPGRLPQEGVSLKDTDYFMLGVEEAPLH